jgi:hypothetical protein
MRHQAEASYMEEGLTQTASGKLLIAGAHGDGVQRDGTPLNDNHELVD